jgi:hypothetical protein
MYAGTNRMLTAIFTTCPAALKLAFFNNRLGIVEGI